jgi:hypothetical protein
MGIFGASTKAELDGLYDRYRAELTAVERTRLEIERVKACLADDADKTAVDEAVASAPDDVARVVAEPQKPRPIVEPKPVEPTPKPSEPEREV